MLLLLSCSVLLAGSQPSAVPGPEAWGEVRVSPGPMPQSRFTFTPDGRELVFFGYYKTYRHYDVAAGRMRLEVNCDDSPHAVAVSPDGGLVASGEWTNGLRLRDARTGRVLHTFAPPEGFGVSQPAFLPGDRVAAHCYTPGGSGPHRGLLAVWNLATKALVTTTAETVDGPDEYFRSHFAGFGPQYLTLYKEARRRVVRQVAVTDPVSLATRPPVALGADDDKVYDISPDGRTLLVQNVHAAPRLVDVATGRTVHQLDGHERVVTCGAFSPDGKRVVTATAWNRPAVDRSLGTDQFPGRPTEIVLWDAGTGKRTARFADQTGLDIASVGFSPDGKYVAALTAPPAVNGRPGDGGGRLVLWGTLPAAVAGGGATATAAAGHSPGADAWGEVRVSPGRMPADDFTVSPDGREVVFHGVNAHPHVYDVAAGRVTREYLASGAGSATVSFAPDGITVAAARLSDGLTLHDRRTGRVVDRPVPAGGRLMVLTAHYLPDGKLAAVCYRAPDGDRGGHRLEINIHDPAVRNNEGWLTIPPPDAPGETVTPQVAGNGRHVVLVGHRAVGGHMLPRSVALYDPLTLSGTRRVPLEDGDEYVLDASPDGLSVLVFNRRRPVRLVDLVTGKAVREFPGHAQLVTTAAFSPDGKLIATASGAGRRPNLPGGPVPPAATPTEIVIWEAATGRKVAEYRDPRTPHDYRKVAFGPDGRYVAAVTAPEEPQTTASAGGRLVLWGRLPTATSAPPAAPAPAPDATEVERLQAEVDRLKAEVEALRRKPERPPAPPAARFKDHGEYVEDTDTGLLWQKDGAAAGRFNYYGAYEYAVKLKLGEMAGWRLPTAAELKAIDPAADGVLPAPTAGAAGGGLPAFWTGELDVSTPDHAYLYTWHGGANNTSASHNRLLVRCVHDPVRKGPAAPILASPPARPD